MRAPREDPARRTAYDVVLAVDTADAYANLLLPRLLRERRLGVQDAAFATELAYGALRRQGVLDVVIAAAARRSIDAIDPPVRAVLRLGAYQLLHLRVPSHAAVDSSVELARATTGERVVGFVNAVLRKVARQSWESWQADLAPADEVGRLAFARGYPEWVARALLDALGGDVDELAAALVEERPVTHLVARPGRITREDLLAEAGSGAIAGPWSPYAVRLESGGDPAALAAVRSGRAGVQDEGSQLVALALTRVDVDGGDRHWADLCAGPGGKTAMLDGLLPAGADLLATDVQPHRARLVRQAVPGPSTLVVVADGTRPAWRPGSFDRILVDAPCTGLGALRRRPEVRWRRSADDARRLQDLQVGLLVAALGAVRPGGVVAYVTCSPHPLETRGVVARARTEGPRAELLDARPLLPGVPDLGAGPDVQLWPHRHGTDAMYLAVLRALPAEQPSGL